MQFIKIPKQIIKKYPGTVIKVYGALESHCRKNKTFCYPGNKRLSELTGIKTKATLVTAKDILERDGWVEIQERKGKSNIYKLMQMNADFKMIPIEALLVSNTTFKLYCVLLYITHNEETETTLKNIKNISGIKEGRTIRKCMLELASKNFVNITRFPTKYITNWKIHKMNVGIFEPLCGNFCTTMWEKLNYYVGIFEPEANYVEIRLIEANFAKQGQAQKISHHRETDIVSDTKPILNNAETIPSDTNPNTDKAEHSKTYFLDKIHNEIQNTKINAKYKEELIAQLKKESFVAGQARSKLIDDMDDKDFCAFYGLLSSDETNFLHSDYWHRFGSIEFATEPPKINRSNLRKNHKIKLSKENFYGLLDYRDAGFGGKADIVDAYVQHEMKLWDFKKTPLKDAEVFFQKEICFGHPVARHYLNMTPEQRQRELELYAQ